MKRIGSIISAPHLGALPRRLLFRLLFSPLRQLLQQRYPSYGRDRGDLRRRVDVGGGQWLEHGHFGGVVAGGGVDRITEWRALGTVQRQHSRERILLLNDCQGFARVWPQRGFILLGLEDEIELRASLAGTQRIASAPEAGNPELLLVGLVISGDPRDFLIIGGQVRRLVRHGVRDGLRTSERLLDLELVLSLERRQLVICERGVRILVIGDLERGRGTGVRRRLVSGPGGHYPFLTRRRRRQRALAVSIAATVVAAQQRELTELSDHFIVLRIHLEQFRVPGAGIPVIAAAPGDVAELPQCDEVLGIQR